MFLSKRRAQLLTEHRGEVQGYELPAFSCGVDEVRRVLASEEHECLQGRLWE